MILKTLIILPFLLSALKMRCELCKKMLTGYQDTKIYFLRIASVDLYFIKYISKEQLYLNGLPIRSGQVYTFAKGGSLRSPQGHAIYYSDISSTFLSDIIIHKLSFTVENLSYNFMKGILQLIISVFRLMKEDLSEYLGASGSGKTTLAKSDKRNSEALRRKRQDKRT